MTKEKEKENLRVSKLMDKKTSELIDLITDSSDEDCMEIINQLDSRYPFDILEERHTESEKNTEEITSRLVKIEERLDKLDAFWNIANKLDMILDRLPRKKGEYNRRQKKL